VPLTDCKFVWKNGAIVPWAEATVHVSSHALHYGTGVFEGIRCYDTPRGPAVFRIVAHIDRWFRSAQVYGMEFPYTRRELCRAALQVIRANGFHDCYIRPIAFCGSHSLSVDPHGCPIEVVILAWPWASYLGPEAAAKGIDLCMSPWRKFSSHAIPATAKATGQYLNSVLAIRDAVARGFREALLVGETGAIAEGSGENLFLVKDHCLYTNDEHSSVLLGITRDTVLSLAADLHIPVRIGPLELGHLLAADEAFLTGTAAEIAPIATVDLRPIGRGTRGPVTTDLQQAYFDAVTGRNLKHGDWLTYLSWIEDTDTKANGSPGMKRLH
jgi:branched-chain amino acid aminotransferase